MKILNDKFGLSYLSGNAQYLYANTSTSQQFDTITANNFLSTGNLTFTINASGLYATSVYAPQGNVSAANILISGNLFIGGSYGNPGDFMVQTENGIQWTPSSFSGGEIARYLLIANTWPSANLVSGALQVRGGASIWGNIYANGNVVLTGSNVSISNVQIGQGWDYTRFRSNANLMIGNIQELHSTGGNITTLSAINFTTGNGTITGSSSGIGAFKTSASSNNWTVSAIGNIYATNGVITNFSSANGTITGSASGIGATKSSATSNNWSVSAIGNIYAINGFITNFSTANGTITGSSSGIGAFKTSASSNNWSVSAIGNVYSTNGVITNFSTANGTITGSSSGIGATKSSSTSNNWTISPIGNVYSTNGVITNFSSSNVLVAAGTVSQAPLRLTAGTSLTVPAAGAIEYDGTAFYATTSTSLGRSYLTSPVFTSGVGTSGATIATDYALFPAANDTITLPVGTYDIEMSYRIDVSGSTDAATCDLNIRGTGTAVGTFAGISLGTTVVNTPAFSIPFAATALGTQVVVTPTTGANPRNYVVFLRGILKITTSGTIIPSYRFSATLNAGTVTLYADNTLTITPMSNSGTTTVVGAWS